MMLFRVLLILLVMSSSSLATGLNSMSSYIHDDNTVIVLHEEQEQRKDGLTDGIDRSRNNEQAVLTERSTTNQVNNFRPQRFIPSNGQKPSRLAGRFGFIAKHHKPVFYYHDSRRRLEQAPFSSVASCAYYVYALRRILC